MGVLERAKVVPNYLHTIALFKYQKCRTVNWPASMPLSSSLMMMLLSQPKKSKPFLRPPRLRSSPSGPVFLPSAWRVVTSRTSSPTLVQELALLPLPVRLPLAEPLLLLLRRKRKKRKKNPKRSLMTIWALVFSTKFDPLNIFIECHSSIKKIAFVSSIKHVVTQLNEK